MREGALRGGTVVAYGADDHRAGTLHEEPRIEAHVDVPLQVGEAAVIALFQPLRERLPALAERTAPRDAAGVETHSESFGAYFVGQVHRDKVR